MNKKYYILSFLILLLLSACNTNNPVFEPQELKIKSETKWLIDNRTDAKIRTVSYKEYDPNNRLIKSEDFDDAGYLRKLVTLSYQQNLRLEHVTNYMNGVETNTIHNSYVINSNGQITERISQNHNGDTIDITRYLYDFKGNITEEATYDKDGNLKGKKTFEFEYNMNGFVIGRIVGDDLMHGFLSKDTIIYKPEKNVVERFTYNSLGSLEVMITYYYDINGNVLREILTDRDGNIIRKYKYEYKYF